jgi:hypothetical protein
VKKNHCAIKTVSTRTLNNIVQNQVYKSHGPRELGEAIIRKTVLYVFNMGKLFLKSSNEEPLAQKS